MPTKIVHQRAGHNGPLSQHRYMSGNITAYFGQKQRVVRASQHNCVDIAVGSEKLLQIASHEVVGTIAPGFHILHQRHPHGARA